MSLGFPVFLLLRMTYNFSNYFCLKQGHYDQNVLVDLTVRNTIQLMSDHFGYRHKKKMSNGDCLNSLCHLSLSLVVITPLDLTQKCFLNSKFYTKHSFFFYRYFFQKILCFYFTRKPSNCFYKV